MLDKKEQNKDQKGQEEIAKFIETFFNWTYGPHQQIGATCDKEAYMDWQCCALHRQALLEREQFQQTARAIESQYPTFYQNETRPSVLSQAWFIRLSEVSGVPLPDKKTATWLDTSTEIRDRANGGDEMRRIL